MGEHMSRREVCRRAQEILHEHAKQLHQMVRDEQAILDREREEDARMWAEENGFDLVLKPSPPTYEARDDD